MEILSTQRCFSVSVVFVSWPSLRLYIQALPIRALNTHLA